MQEASVIARMDFVLVMIKSASGIMRPVTISKPQKLKARGPLIRAWAATAPGSGVSLKKMA